MPRARLACLLLLVVAACSDPEPENRPVLRIDVTSDGGVVCAGERRSIRELIDLFHRQSFRTRVFILAPASASWLHVQWVMAAAGEAGHRAVLLGLDDGADAVRVPVDAGSMPAWTGFIPPWMHPDFDGTAHFGALTVTSRPDRVFLWSGSDVEGGEEEVVARGDLRSRVRRFMDAARATEGDASLLSVVASERAPLGAVLPALRAAVESDPQRLLVGIEALHPWDRELRTLPAPSGDEPICGLGGWLWTDLRYVDVPPLNLPLASMAQEDKDDDPDDRVILSLTSDGTLIWKNEELTLADLADVLEIERIRYRKKMRRLFKDAFEESGGERWSKLYVLLRADRDASWRHVRWIAAELHDARIYRLQLAAAKFPYTARKARELERMAAGAAIHPFFPYDGKLQVFQATCPEPETRRLPILVDPAAGATFEHLREIDLDRLQERLARRIAGLGEDANYTADVAAGPGTRVGPVVAVLDRLARIRCEKVDIAGAEPAEGELRDQSPLPAVPD